MKTDLKFIRIQFSLTVFMSFTIIDGGTAEYYSIDNPDFNFHQFRSNFVAKWEYRLGSFIYLVWSTEKTGNNGSSEASFGDSYKMLRSVFPKNIFLIKLNYWFSL